MIGFRKGRAVLAGSLAAVIGAYGVYAACNGKTPIDTPSTVPASCPSCREVVTKSQDCADPTPPNPNVHCERVAGTVTTETRYGTCYHASLILQLGYWVCTLGASGSCDHCGSMGAPVIGTGPGYKVKTDCPPS